MLFNIYNFLLYISGYIDSKVRKSPLAIFEMVLVVLPTKIFAVVYLIISQ